MTDRQDKVLTTLRWFVFRARRVAEHSLVVDRDRLLTWAQGAMTVNCVGGVPQSLEMRLPHEEPFESLAGRVRPFIMDKDHLYFKKVFDALRPLLEQDTKLTEALDMLQQRWSRLNPKSGRTLGYAMQVGECAGPLGRVSK